ncbi:MAG: hypothetical protein GXP42_09030 [Chloroflexi bacterium]|nr:hypothetical protein [Chloroflexota bacterium]
MFRDLDLPEDLKNRLLAAGVEDEATLERALEADEALRADYERWIIGQILQAFAATPDEKALRELVRRAPFLLEAPMFDAIERAIAAARQKGDRRNATALNQRLDVLRVIKAERDAFYSKMADALKAFVQAENDEAARGVFETHRDLLMSDDAEAFLISHFQADNETARRHLEQRTEFLRRLRIENSVSSS